MPGTPSPLTSPSIMDSITEGVGVVVRVRPMSTKERADPSVHTCIQALSDIVVIDANAHKRPTSADPKGLAGAAPASKSIRASTRPYQFSVDHVFHSHASQLEVYKQSCKPIVEGVFHGINGSILAYGATGSGKTHTMFGSTMSAAGIVYQAVQDIFAEKERLEEEEGKRVRVKCSFLEVYNEDVFDLLVTADNASDANGSSNNNSSNSGRGRVEKRVPLQVLEAGHSGTSNNGELHIPGLTYIFPETLEDFARGVEHGHAQRFVAATGANAQSSRSHAIITVEVEVRDVPGREGRASATPEAVEPPSPSPSASRDDLLEEAGNGDRSDSGGLHSGRSPSKHSARGTGHSNTNGGGGSSARATPGKRKKEKSPHAASTVTIARIQFGDLAGSERAAATSNTGMRLREGGNINRSLLALGAVVQSLAQQKYRRKHMSNTTTSNGISKSFIPYRGSKLTRLLRDSIGGNCRTMMLFCVSPSTRHIEETVNTMKFAMNAREIQVVARRNEFAVNSTQLAKTQEAVIEELRAELARTREALSCYNAGGEVPGPGLVAAVCAGNASGTRSESPAATFARETSSISVESPTAGGSGGEDAEGNASGGAAGVPQRSGSSGGAPGVTEAPAAAAVGAGSASTPPPPLPGLVTKATPQRDTMTPSASAACAAVSPLSVSAVEVSANSSVMRASVGSRVARRSVFAENSPLFSGLEAQLKDFAAQKEILYHELRDAEELQREEEAQLREQQWRLATFLVSDACGSRARGEMDAAGSSEAATDTVGVAGMRNTIATLEAAQVEHTTQLAELTNRLDEVDRKFAATRAALLRERQGTSLELLLDNARLRQGCTEAECLAAHYHQECRSLLKRESEYAEALSKCVGALQRLKPVLAQLARNSVSSADINSAAAAAEVADAALLFALLPTASTNQRMQVFESALRATTLAQQQQQQQQQQPQLSSPPTAFVHPPLAPSPTNRSMSNSTSPMRPGRSGSTPQSIQLVEHFRDFIATAEMMNSKSNSNGSGVTNADGVQECDPASLHARHAHPLLTNGGEADKTSAAPAEPGTGPVGKSFGRTVSLTGLTASSEAADAEGRKKPKKKKAAVVSRVDSGLRPGAGGRHASGFASPAKRPALQAAPAAVGGPAPLQRCFSAPLPFRRAASAPRDNNSNSASPAPRRPGASITTPDRRPKSTLKGRTGPAAKVSGVSSRLYASPKRPAAATAAPTSECKTPKKNTTTGASRNGIFSPKPARPEATGTSTAAFARSNTTSVYSLLLHSSSNNSNGGSTRPGATPTQPRRTKAKAPPSSSMDETTATTPHTPGSAGSSSAPSTNRSRGDRKGKPAATPGGKRVTPFGGAGGGKKPLAAGTKVGSRYGAAPPPLVSQQQRFKERRNSAAAVSVMPPVDARRLVRSHTTTTNLSSSSAAATAAAERPGRSDGGHDKSMISLSPLLSPCSSLGGHGGAASIRRKREDVLSPDSPFYDPPPLTVASLLERSNTVPALPQYSAGSPVFAGGEGWNDGKVGQPQRLGQLQHQRMRASTFDDLTVSRSTCLSDTSPKSRDLIASP